MKLAVSMRVTSAATYVERRDALAQDWAVWVESFGYQPLFVPNSLRDPAAFFRSLGVGGLVLTGGNDLVERYGHSGDIAPERTRTENVLIEEALAARIPILGVCRGIHMINAHFGGSLTAELSAVVPPLLQHVARVHQVELRMPFSELAQSRVVEVNSFHNQGVTGKDVSRSLTVFATTSDGVVEGVVHPDLPVLGIQWHPERPNAASSFDAALANRLMKEGAFWKGKLS